MKFLMEFLKFLRYSSEKTQGILFMRNIQYPEILKKCLFFIVKGYESIMQLV